MSLVYRLSMYVPRWIRIIIFWILCLLVFLIVCVIGIRTAGIEGSLGTKVSGFYNFIYWQSRELSFDFSHIFDDESGIVKPDAVHNGVLVGLTKDGDVVLEILGQSERMLAPLADLEIKDFVKAALELNALKDQHVLIDEYFANNKHYYVLWLSTGEPVNQILLNKGVASAVENPPTNIVNDLMSDYYWKVMFGEVFHD